MKQIEPVVFPLNLGTASLLNAYCINDNLSDSATFYYALLSDTQSQLQQGNLNMTGEAYAQWEVDSYAWDWIAAKLNLTITGEYVSPALPQSELTPEVNEAS